MINQHDHIFYHLSVHVVTPADFAMAQICHTMGSVGPEITLISLNKTTHNKSHFQRQD